MNRRVRVFLAVLLVVCLRPLQADDPARGVAAHVCLFGRVAGGTVAAQMAETRDAALLADEFAARTCHLVAVVVVIAARKDCFSAPWARWGDCRRA